MAESCGGLSRTSEPAEDGFWANDWIDPTPIGLYWVDSPLELDSLATGTYDINNVFNNAKYTGS